MRKLQTNTTKQGRQIFTSKKKRQRSDHVVFIIFLFLSATFWLLVKLSQEYSLSYNMTVSYKNVPKNKLITKVVDTTVTFNITARGFYLAELQLLHPEELIINLSNYTIHHADDNLYYISTTPLKERIAKLLDINPSNVDFSKSTLSFYLEKLYNKKIAVKPHINLNLDPMYKLYKPPVIHPEKVTVYGPKAVLDTMKFVTTDRMEINNLRDSATIVLTIHNPDPTLLHFEPEHIKIHLDVQKFTQSSLSIPISFTEKTRALQTFPAKTTVYYNVALRDFDKVKPSDFLIVPDIENVNLSKADKLHLKVVRKPDFVRDVLLDPEDVEFILLK